jgi:hypothetical protein
MLAEQPTDLFGPVGAQMKDFCFVVHLYFDKVSEAGGIKGMQVTVESLDDGYVPDRARMNTRELAANKSVSVFLASAAHRRRWKRSKKLASRESELKALREKPDLNTDLGDYKITNPYIELVTLNDKGLFVR